MLALAAVALAKLASLLPAALVLRAGKSEAAFFARRGDLLFIDNDTPQGAIGVVGLDGRFASCASGKGLVLVRLHRWKRAWNVG